MWWTICLFTSPWYFSLLQIQNTEWWPITDNWTYIHLLCNMMYVCITMNFCLPIFSNGICYSHASHKFSDFYDQEFPAAGTSICNILKLSWITKVFIPALPCASNESACTIKIIKIITVFGIHSKPITPFNYWKSPQPILLHSSGKICWINARKRIEFH